MTCGLPLDDWWLDDTLTAPAEPDAHPIRLSAAGQTATDSMDGWSVIMHSASNMIEN